MTTTTMYFLAGLLLVGASVGTSYTIVRLGRVVRDQGETLDRVRSATYELTSMSEVQIHDLRDSLRAAGIPVGNEHVAGRLRRMRLTPEESLAEFEATIAHFDALRRGDTDEV